MQNSPFSGKNRRIRGQRSAALLRLQSPSQLEQRPSRHHITGSLRTCTLGPAANFTTLPGAPCDPQVRREPLPSRRQPRPQAQSASPACGRLGIQKARAGQGRQHRALMKYAHGVRPAICPVAVAGCQTSPRNCPIAVQSRCGPRRPDAPTLAAESSARVASKAPSAPPLPTSPKRLGPQPHLQLAFSPLAARVLSCAAEPAPLESKRRENGSSRVNSPAVLLRAGIEQPP